MRTAIICYSFTHNNLMLAAELQSRTRGTLVQIEEKKKRSKSTIFLDLFLHRTPAIKTSPELEDQFDHYILVSPVWGGKIATPLKSFLLKGGSKIRSYSFISVCGGGKSQQAAIEMELTGILKNKPVLVSQLSLSELCKDHPLDLANYQIVKADLEYFSDEIYNFTSWITRQVEAVTTI